VRTQNASGNNAIILTHDFRMYSFSSSTHEATETWVKICNQLLADNRKSNVMYAEFRIYASARLKLRRRDCILYFALRWKRLPKS
jgi:hypothetical protein